MHAAIIVCLDVYGRDPGVFRIIFIHCISRVFTRDRE